MVEAPCDFGLISGYRRLSVYRSLAKIRANGDYTTIPAFIRTPASVPAAMAAMVTENEVRTDVTPWEKATLILESVPANLRSSAMAASIFMIHLFGDMWSPKLVGYWSDAAGLQKAVLVLPGALLAAAALWLGLGWRTLCARRAAKSPAGPAVDTPPPPAR